MDARPITIAVDGMGGDYGLPVTLPSTIQFLSQKPEVRCLLVGDEGAIRSAIAEQKPDAALLSRLEIVHASEAVGMDEPIAVAMRGKKDSSMRRSLECLLDGRAQACVSAGNTGALMALSRMLLKTMEGIDRPAIAAQIPNVRGGATMVLDLGANVDCSAEHLLQFAMMGAALSSALDQSRRPSIGLLNIGEEMIKGNDVVKQAGELLRSSSLNFVGNVEGKDIFSGTVDVVVCDGFVGNVALKTSEGLASMLSQTLREEYGRGPMSKLAALVSMPVIRRIRRRMDHRRYNGASLIGLRGIVFKSHGSADDMAFQAALARAADAVEHRLIDQIAQTLPEARALGHVNSAAAPSADAQAHAASIMPGSALAIGQVQSH
ncbi:MAG: phosphate acyltransferase PlsX [Betaproteobacteria bacterium]|nr:phosphate acyltransferase PlsX [Betaproteobacteria bacterium]NDA22903.1 phosphate acyltransferase PlsX [Betaproteobacteria bacterium]NDA35002.1 phosphate acyltransferase PlsX [Betaproteobacteria bacterium]NDF77425.1 phosphate acyltransferase PlsX [Betaproteobacteria bacterium]